MTIPSATRAEIHLDRLRHNVLIIQKVLGSVDLIGVVKADAYGHGAVRVAQTLSSLGVNKLAVATVSEAAVLRAAGIGGSILVFAPPSRDKINYYAELDLDVVVDSEESFAVVSSLGSALPCHVKVDTGMGRLGQSPEKAVQLVHKVQQHSSTRLASIWTHFARGDEPESDFTAIQFERFLAFRKAVGENAAPFHSAASGSAFAFPQTIDPSSMSMARIGIALYGLLDLPPVVAPSPGITAAQSLQPVMEFKSEITALKTVPAGTPISYGNRWTAPSERVIATVGAGYADGVSRVLSNKGFVRINGNRYPMVGSVCMDMFMVDLGAPDTLDSAIQLGSEVSIFGAQSPTCAEVAAQTNSITYVQVCGISGRVPRFYLP